GFGLEGKYTQEQGFLAYFEVLELMEDNHWRKETDDVGSPYIVKGDQWIGYDNPDSIATKMSYIRKNMLGGAMIWAIDLDDFHGLYGEKWPLLSVVKNALLDYLSFKAEYVTDDIDVIVAVEAKPEQLPGPVLSPPVPVVIPPVAGSPVSVEKGVMNCTGQGFVRDSNDCAVYYRCEWAMKHTYICPEGLFYDSQLTLCNWPELTDLSFPSCHHGANHTGFDVCVVPPVMVSTAGSVAVICQSNGMFEDSYDCRGYYVCQDGQPQRYTCSLGQSFNPSTGLCHYGTSPRCATQVKTRQYYEDEFIGGLPCSIICLRGLTLRRAASTCSVVSEEDYKVMCYFTNWAWYRKGEGKFVPEHLDSRLCTHIVYAYASLDPNDLVIKPFDPWADIDNNFYQRITGTGRPGAGAVNVLLALGGWTDSSGDKYSRLVSNGSARRKFVTSVVAYLRRHNFRGLQLDWTYPKCWQSNCGKGPSSDKPNFTKLELKKEFKRNNPPLLLTASISGYKEVIDEAYDLPNIGRELDLLSVMTYDYHGSWERRVGHVSPLYYRQGDQFPQFNTNFTMEYLVSKGAPRKKLLVGIPFYGQSFTLESPQSYNQGAEARVKNQRWSLERDSFGATGPYAHSGDQWVGFEDVDSVKEKVMAQLSFLCSRRQAVVSSTIPGKGVEREYANVQ
ncbi:unnamed protein product, partial [Timema podura]|nr:unnamed protein product [Timema podura]